MKFLATVAMMLFVTACAGVQSRNEETAVFLQPQLYVGKTVTVCGYIHDRFEDNNIWPSAFSDRDTGAGLGFIAARQSGEESQHDGHKACVVGEIVRTGCGEDQICSWSNYRYALKEASLAKKE